MTAMILPFPSRPVDAERLALLGQTVAKALPLPERDAELELLLKMGARLLDNLNDAALDHWLARVTAWEGQKQR